MYVGANLSTAPLHDCERATATRNRWSDPHSDAQTYGLPNSLALSAERWRSIVNALECPREIARHIDVRGDGRLMTLLLFGVHRTNEQHQEHRRHTHPRLGPHDLSSAARAIGESQSKVNASRRM
jgi:hypothetical protein